MRFTKMHGIGNDYIYVDTTIESVKDPAKLAKAMSRPHFGVGSDGLVSMWLTSGCEFSTQTVLNLKCAAMLPAASVSMCMSAVSRIKPR